jgi:hypothetical protein
MTTPWVDLVRLLVDGELVRAGVTNRPTQDLTRRTDYLKELLETLQAGQALVDTTAVLAPGLSVGTPVYRDSIDGIYKAAVADGAASAQDGVVPASAYVAGVISLKSADTTGVVTLYGLAALTTAEWASVIDTGVFAPGQYYLAAAPSGKLTAARGGAAIYVGQLLADGTMRVGPKPPSYAEHTHRQFDLVGAPAGTVVDPSPGGTHTVGTPDTGQRGWLPATPTYFPGWTVGVQIPSNAKFGYNLDHPSEVLLKAAFPPTPIETAVATQSGLTISPAPLLINSYGIWWVDDAYGKAPWSTDYAVSGFADTISMWMTRPQNAGQFTTVTSLAKDPASVLDIQVVNQVGSLANKGSLYLKVLSILAQNGGNTDEGAYALKSVAGGQYTRGPVAARVKAGANVTVSGTQGDGTNGWFGDVTVAASAANTVLTPTLDSIQGGAYWSALNGDFKVIMLPWNTGGTIEWTTELYGAAGTTASVIARVWTYAGSPGPGQTNCATQYKAIPIDSGSSIQLAAPGPSWSTKTYTAETVTGIDQIRPKDITLTGVPLGSRLRFRYTRDPSVGGGYTGLVGLVRVQFLLA